MCSILLVEDHKIMASGARGDVWKDALHDVRKGIRRVLEGGTCLRQQLKEEQ